TSISASVVAGVYLRATGSWPRAALPDVGGSHHVEPASATCSPVTEAPVVWTSTRTRVPSVFRVTSPMSVVLPTSYTLTGGGVDAPLGAAVTRRPAATATTANRDPRRLTIAPVSMRLLKHPESHAEAQLNVSVAVSPLEVLGHGVDARSLRNLHAT